MKKWIIVLAVTVATCQAMSDQCQKKCFSRDCTAQCVMAEMVCKALAK
jgi:hypothetical protein